MRSIDPGPRAKCASSALAPDQRRALSGERRSKLRHRARLARQRGRSYFRAMRRQAIKRTIKTKAPKITLGPMAVRARASAA